jgi:hypothetical protein
MVIIKTQTNEMVVRKLYYVPDYKYLLSKGYDISNVMLGKSNDDFTGLLITKKWNDELLSYHKVKNGKINQVLVKYDINSPESNSLHRISMKNYASARTSEFEEQNLQDVTVYGTPYRPTTYVYFGFTQPYYPSPTSSYDPYGTYGGGGGGSTTNPYVTITLIGPRVKIVDINEYLKCFNLTQNATLIIYVDQPKPNSSDSYTLGGDVGHTFIALQQGEIRRVLGYYPATSVDPYGKTTDISAFGNNENHFFDVSISTPISSVQLLNILGHCNNAPKTYDLNTYNCTDFAIQIGNLAGLNLPDSSGTWPNGGGSNPGQLGQNIRPMALPANSYKQTTGANSASNKGECK